MAIPRTPQLAAQRLLDMCVSVLHHRPGDFINAKGVQHHWHNDGWRAEDLGNAVGVCEAQGWIKDDKLTASGFDQGGGTLYNPVYWAELILKILVQHYHLRGGETFTIHKLNLYWNMDSSRRTDDLKAGLQKAVDEKWLELVDDDTIKLTNSGYGQA